MKNFRVIFWGILCCFSFPVFSDVQFQFKNGSAVFRASAVPADDRSLCLYVSGENEKWHSLHRHSFQLHQLTREIKKSKGDKPLLALEALEQLALSAFIENYGAIFLIELEDYISQLTHSPPKNSYFYQKVSQAFSGKLSSHNVSWSNWLKERLSLELDRMKWTMDREDFHLSQKSSVHWVLDLIRERESGPFYAHSACPKEPFGYSGVEKIRRRAFLNGESEMEYGVPSFEEETDIFRRDMRISMEVRQREIQKQLASGIFQKVPNISLPGPIQISFRKS